jgi:hypothetical protein
MSLRQLEDAAGDVDQIDRRAVAEWAADAIARDLIEPTPGSDAVRRWNITDAGRRAIGNEPGR